MTAEETSKRRSNEMCSLCSLVVGSDEENFCATVPKDGRSYSPTLFSQTARVLRKINKPGDMIVSFGLLADKIKVRECSSRRH